MKIVKWFDGKKTIIAALFGAILSALRATEVITQSEYEALAGTAAFLGMIFLRLSLHKASRPVMHLDIVPIAKKIDEGKKMN